MTVFLWTVSLIGAVYCVYRYLKVPVQGGDTNRIRPSGQQLFLASKQQTTTITSREKRNGANMNIEDFDQKEGIEDIAEMDFYQLRARKLNGEVISMSEYKGKVVLIENTASL